MHVLAHVTTTAAIAASVHDPAYVRWADAALGPASERALAEDAAVLGRSLASHETLARAQLLAWLFDDAERAAAVAQRDLGELHADEVDRPALLAPLIELGPALEVLRCAAELEREGLAALGSPRVDGAELGGAVEALVQVAPELATSRLSCLRSLRLRGRLYGDEIWIGAPGPELNLATEHVAWQAAHEATVREVAHAGRLVERSVEAVALVLLAERAERAGRREAHHRWLAHLAGPPPIDAAALSLEERDVLQRARSGQRAGMARS